MVEYADYTLDSIFHSLADATRRDILARVYRSELTISSLARDYDMSFAAVAKHLRVLEKAKLIIKLKRGKERVIMANPASINEAMKHLGQYKQLWDDRHAALDELLRDGG